MISAEIDSKLVSANIKKLVKNVGEGVPKGMLDVGHEIMRLSQIEVPHDEGSLQNSGTVDEIGGDVIVGYHEPYAARLHEHPEYRFQKGRKGKYLEDPIKRNEDVLGVRLGKNLQGEISK